MLFFVGPLIVFVVVFFSCMALWTRGDWEESAGWSFLSLFPGFFIFAVLVPAISTAAADQWRYPVDGEITSDIKKVDDNYSFWVDDEFVALTKNDEGYIQFAPLRDGENDYFRRKCDVTPSWAAPYNMGSCYHIISTDKDFD